MTGAGALSPETGRGAFTPRDPDPGAARDVESARRRHGDGGAVMTSGTRDQTSADLPEGEVDLETSSAPGLPDLPLRTVLEALLLVTDEPVPATSLAHACDASVTAVEQALVALAAEWSEQGRGLDLRQVAGGWRLYARSACAPYVERLLLEGQQARLTQAALETLAVIAYRQPVTRSRVSAVRGVNVDGVVRTLLTRGLIVDAGQDPDSAGTLYRTTALFLERLGLVSLDGLPALAPLLPDLDDLDDTSTSE